MTEHNHCSHHSHSTSSKNLILAIFINIIIVIFEIIFGLLSRSFALITDALHNFTDIASMVLSLWGEKLKEKPKTERKTYGYKRAEIIIAFVNASLLLAIVSFVLIKATIRLFNPEPVSSTTIMFVALVALIGNSLATYLLQKQANDNLNLKSAFLHSLQDALLSLGVVISAILMYFTGWLWLDPLASILISIFLLKEIFSLLFETIDMLMDSVPKHINLVELKEDLLKIAGIIEINDLHIWQIGSKNYFLSTHIKTKDLNSKERIELIVSSQNLLEKKYKIQHTTIQTISIKELEFMQPNCHHCS